MNQHVGHWPLNHNHEAARRHVDEVLRDHAWNGCSRRETAIAELLDDLVRERDELRSIVYPAQRGRFHA
jgi:hypothetical protein